ncbi:MAG TPA: hypothetical protein VFM16_01770 [Holophagaceae bacterium]|nr:hypothetical protein [Holophagaceae bacterium]
MSHRKWKHLDKSKSYVISASDGWKLQMNGDGTVTLSYPGGAEEGTGGGYDLSLDPDPGSGDPNPPM